MRYRITWEINNRICHADVDRITLFELYRMLINKADKIIVYSKSSDQAVIVDLELEEIRKTEKSSIF